MVRLSKSMCIYMYQLPPFEFTQLPLSICTFPFLCFSPPYYMLSTNLYNELLSPFLARIAKGSPLVFVEQHLTVSQWSREHFQIRKYTDANPQSKYSTYQLESQIVHVECQSSITQKCEEMQSRSAQVKCEQLIHDWKEWHEEKIHSRYFRRVTFACLKGHHGYWLKTNQYFSIFWWLNAFKSHDFHDQTTKRKTCLCCCFPYLENVSTNIN